MWLFFQHLRLLRDARDGVNVSADDAFRAGLPFHTGGHGTTAAGIYMIYMTTVTAMTAAPGRTICTGDRCESWGGRPLAGRLSALTPERPGFEAPEP